MKTLRSFSTRLTAATFGALLSAGAALAAPGPLSDSPLFLSDAVEPNIIVGLDNSGSMDGEILLPSNDGAAWWNTGDRSFVGRDNNDNVSAGTINYNRNGGSSNTWRKYVYLFPNGRGTDAQRTYGVGNNHFAVPPTAEHAWLRSANYNAGYYDPATD